MSRKSFGEESASNREQSPPEWLEELTRDFGGWRVFGAGIAMTLCGAFMGVFALFTSGAFMMSAAILLAVVGWFTRK